MQREGTSAMKLKDLLLVSCTVCLIFQSITAMDIGPSGSEGTESNVGCILCGYIAGLTKSQMDLCCRTPLAIVVLSSEATQGTLRAECKWQLRKELWNCSEIGMPLFQAPNLPENREKAFISALASATTVHRITHACSNGELGSECTCDYSRNGLRTVQGWTWGSCSDNVSYGVSFAQRFLDEKEFDLVDMRNTTSVEQAVIHLHNNNVGRKAVSDNMGLSCRCHGFSGSCAVRTCWRELPTYFEVGDALKLKFDHALQVSVSHSGPQAELQAYDELRDEHYPAPFDSLVYLESPEDYCLSGNFTRNRECLPRDLLDAQRRGEVKAQAGNEYFPPCEDFCCSGDYEAVEMAMEETCNCRFIWCCNVICEICTTTITQYRCTG